MTFEQLISKYTQEISNLSIHAHQLLENELKDIQVYPDEKANIIGYGYSNKYVDLICTIILSKKGIKIGFNRGSELNDPTGILEGSGKVHKYVQINEVADLNNPALKKLIKEAFNSWRKRIKK